MKKTFIFICVSLLSFPQAYGKVKKATPFSLNEYVRMASKKSLRAISADESLMSSKLSWTGTRRDLSWPTLTASASKDKSGTDSDTGTETDTDSKSTTLRVDQPLLTGTNVSVQGTWTDSETESTTGGITTISESETDPLISASVSQPLYIFMRNDKLRTRRQAQIAWENAQDSHRLSHLRIEFDAKSIYYNLLLNLESLKVERKKYESAKLVHQITKALVRAGKRAKVEALRADIRAKTDLRRIQNVENDFEKELNEAKDLILFPTDKPIRLTSKLTYTPFKIKLNRLISLGLQSSPSLNISKRRVELAELSLQSTKEGNRPDVDLNGRYSKTIDNSDNAADPESWNVGVDLSWPIFDATQTRLQKKQSEISLRDTKRSYETDERQLKVDIENAFLDIKRTEEQIKDFKAQRKNATQSLKAIRLQYKNGLTRLTDVFDAENQLRDLDLEYFGLLVDFNTARDRLNILIGQDVSKLKS